jgi:SP family myo-inositol transporter-like MFS transporter 13
MYHQTQYCHIFIRFIATNMLYFATGTFWLYAGMATLGLIFLSLFLPETKGKSLEEVEGLFAQSWVGENTQPVVVPFTAKSVQYVHIRGLNRDGVDSELESPE